MLNVACSISQSFSKKKEHIVAHLQYSKNVCKKSIESYAESETHQKAAIS